MSDITVRAVRPGDFGQWRALYRGYADFYRVEQTEEAAATVWAWVNDPGHEVGALVAEDASGRLLGLAHYRPFARPLSATVGCFLDDLFVAPEHRGSGAADLLLGRCARWPGSAGGAWCAGSPPTTTTGRAPSTTRWPRGPCGSPTTWPPVTDPVSARARAGA